MVLNTIFGYRPNVVLGVTNPFFEKTLNHWPHILRVDNSSFINHDYSSKSSKLSRSVF